MKQENDKFEMTALEKVMYIGTFVLVFVPPFFGWYSFAGAIGICVGLLITGFFINWMYPGYWRSDYDKSGKRNK